jgi:hypothetical protein
MGGSVSGASSSFRQFFHDRITQLGDASNYGSFGGVVSILQDVWQQADSFQPSPGVSGSTEIPYISWRDTMRMRGWDYLLI